MNNIDAILKGIPGEGREKSEALIKKFLQTSDGKTIANAVNQMSAKDLERLMSRVPSGVLENTLGDAEALQKILCDPEALQKIMKNLK